jgi:hypothetical protein
MTMGEAAEMMIDGYLDWDGSYMGDNRNTHYRQNHNEKLYKVFHVLACMGVKQVNRYKFIMEYAQVIGKTTASQTAKFLFSGPDKTNINAFKHWIISEHKHQCKYLNHA